MNDISREDALAHFGVKGMRWGVRKANGQSSGKSTPRRTPIRDFARNVALDETRTAISGHEKARDGVGLIGAVAKIDKRLWGGNGRFEAYQNNRISELKRSEERIKKGELVVTTLLFGPQYTPKKRS
jgi:hypothetical protein